MNKGTIFSLNPDCMFEIFKQIKTQCEADLSGQYSIFSKYVDLINFTLSSDWISNLFSDWNKKFHCFAIEVEYNMDFGKHYDRTWKFTNRNQEKYWNNIVTQIKVFPRLISAILRYDSDPYYERHLEIFDMIMRALQNKYELKELSIEIAGYTLDNLISFLNLNVLKLDVRINADVLVQWCQSNPNLRELYIHNNEMYGRLADIAQERNILQKLEILAFQMKDDIDAVEYAPLAKLPKLNNLQIGGVHKVGSLRHLFRALAEKNTKGYLRLLEIREAEMNDAETEAISKINSLEELISGFTEPENIGQLSQLINLRRLEITSQFDDNKLFAEVFKILNESKIHSIIIKANYAYFEYTELEKEFICKLEKDESQKKLSEKINICEKILEMAAIKPISCLDATFTHLRGIELLWQLQHLQQLTLVVRQNLPHEAIKIVENLFRNIASKTTPTLQYIDIKGVPIDLSSATELVKIKSLKTIKCSFFDSKAIPLLSDLPQLKQLTIRSDHNISRLSEGIFRIIASSIERNICIDWNSSNILIQYDGYRKQLHLTIKKYSEKDDKLCSLITLFETFATNENITLIVFPAP